MDDTDRQLMTLLRQNARLPVSSLAASLGVSRGTVQNRIARLLASGAIGGFTLRARPDGAVPGVRAIMLVEVRGDRSAFVLRALRALPEVDCVHTTNGRWDAVVELRAGTLEAFDAVLRRIRTIDGVANSETSLLLSSTP
jgi:DNA-binding Lrp family transcriptional regulator